ncbi:hypothetical protein DFJ73DRAFT_142817 [Zopfochytrium polystomum]|nr:hypothetical protein DFJ73DRAFT_142817 [Zopfochytrium polystomum]
MCSLPSTMPILVLQTSLVIHSVDLTRSHSPAQEIWLLSTCDQQRQHVFFSCDNSLTATPNHHYVELPLNNSARHRPHDHRNKHLRQLVLHNPTRNRRKQPLQHLHKLNSLHRDPAERHRRQHHNHLPRPADQLRLRRVGPRQIDLRRRRHLRRRRLLDRSRQPFCDRGRQLRRGAWDELQGDGRQREGDVRYVRDHRLLGEHGVLGRAVCDDKVWERGVSADGLPGGRGGEYDRFECGASGGVVGWGGVRRAWDCCRFNVVAMRIVGRRRNRINRDNNMYRSSLVALNLC